MKHGKRSLFKAVIIVYITTDYPPTPEHRARSGRSSLLEFFFLIFILLKIFFCFFSDFPNPLSDFFTFLVFPIFLLIFLPGFFLFFLLHSSSIMYLLHIIFFHTFLECFSYTSSERNFRNLLFSSVGVCFFEAPKFAFLAVFSALNFVMIFYFFDVFH